MTRLEQAVRVLNDIARRELGEHRHRYNRLLCKPHPHEGRHRLGCECSAVKSLGKRKEESMDRYCLRCKRTVIVRRLVPGFECPRCGNVTQNKKG